MQGGRHSQRRSVPLGCFASDLCFSHVVVITSETTNWLNLLRLTNGLCRCLLLRSILDFSLRLSRSSALLLSALNTTRRRQDDLNPPARLFYVGRRVEKTTPVLAPKLYGDSGGDFFDLPCLVGKLSYCVVICRMPYLTPSLTALVPRNHIRGNHHSTAVFAVQAYHEPTYPTVQPSITYLQCRQGITYFTSQDIENMHVRINKAITCPSSCSPSVKTRVLPHAEQGDPTSSGHSQAREIKL